MRELSIREPRAGVLGGGGRGAEGRQTHKKGQAEGERRGPMFLLSCRDHGKHCPSAFMNATPSGHGQTLPL